MNDQHFTEVAAELDDYIIASDDELTHAVRYQGSCGWLDTTGETPRFTGDDDADRELVAPVCAGCPVQRECLEWEFRTSGYAIGNVWGPLSPADRRAVYLHWRDRRDDAGRAGGR